MKTQKLILISIFLIGIVSLSIWWFSGENLKTEDTGKPIPVRFSISNIPAYSQFVLAKELNYFSDAGIEPTIIIRDNGIENLGTIFNGEADFTAASEYPIVATSFTRDDFFIIGTVGYTYDLLKLVVREDASIHNPADFIGKNVGTAHRTISQLAFEVFLTHHKILAEEVNILDLKFEEFIPSIESGTVDAIIIWDPIASLALNKLGIKGSLYPLSQTFRYAGNLVAGKSFVNEHPEAILRVLEALDRATDFMKKDPKQAAILVSKSMNLKVSNVERILTKLHFGLTLDQRLLVSLEGAASWFVKHQYTDHKDIPNYLDFIYFKGLKTVSPESVTMYGND